MINNNGKLVVIRQLIITFIVVYQFSMAARVSIASSGNISLSGKFWRTNLNAPVIVFVHQYATMGGQSSLMDGMALESVKYGYNAITFDLRFVDNVLSSASYLRI